MAKICTNCLHEDYHVLGCEVHSWASNPNSLNHLWGKQNVSCCFRCSINICPLLVLIKFCDEYSWEKKQGSLIVSEKTEVLQSLNDHLGACAIPVILNPHCECRNFLFEFFFFLTDTNHWKYPDQFNFQAKLP